MEKVRGSDDALRYLQSAMTRDLLAANARESSTGLCTQTKVFGICALGAQFMVYKKKNI